MTEPARMVRVGVVQAAQAFLQRSASVDRACDYIADAGRSGIQLLAFPEGFVPAHPLWYHFLPASSPQSVELASRLFENAVEVPGPDVGRMCDAAAKAGVNVVIGVCERLPDTSGTLYNTQLFIDDRGRLLGRHRKITPTLGERLVHTGGAGDGLSVHQTSAGRVSGLICGENSNPLAACALAAEGTQIHVASWPNHFAQGEHRPLDLVQMVSRGVAYSMGAFVLNACGTISPEIAQELSTDNPAAAAFLADRSKGGGSVIVGPDSTIVAGPMDGSEEGILSADIDLRQCVKAKHIHDYIGHYNRPDIFRLTVNRSANNLVERVEDDATSGTPPSESSEQMMDDRQPSTSNGSHG